MEQRFTDMVRMAKVASFSMRLDKRGIAGLTKRGVHMGLPANAVERIIATAPPARRVNMRSVEVLE